MMQLQERPLAANECSECSRTMDKAKRVEAGFRYCATCYQRVFVSAPCQRCGKSGRFHKYATEHICRSCQRADRICARCEKPLPHASLIQGKKAYCGPCSEYVKPATLCSGCGQNKRMLSTAPGRGIFTKLCVPCLNRVAGDMATCSRCGRYRKVDGTQDGKAHCAACTPDNPQSYPCSTCGGEVPGAGSSNCSSCAAKARLQKRAQVIASTFDPQYAALVTEYGQWLGLRVTHAVAARKLMAAVPFFSALEKAFPDVAALTMNGVVASVGAGVLRRHLLCHEFLLEHFHWTDDPVVRENLTETARVESKLTAQRNQWWDGLMRAYVLSLQSNGNIKPLTIRLYLNAAVVFLKGSRAGNLQELDQAACDRGLYNRPGLRASVTRFVGWLQDAHGIRLKVAPKKRDPKIYLRRMTGELRAVLQRLGVSENDAERRALLGISLSRLYGVPLKEVLRSKRSDFELVGDEMIWRINGQDLTLTAFIGAWVMHLLTPRNGFDYAFWQGKSMRPLSVGGAEYWGRENGLAKLATTLSAGQVN